MTEPDWAALDAAWRPAREAGVLGSATTEALIAHAAGYLPAACRVDAEFEGLDLGTGAGVPGVVLAALRPASRWILVDGNERRCEFARATVRALDLQSRVDVRHSRVEDLAHRADHRGSFDLVVARSFGAPAELAECALPLTRLGGWLVVSATTETIAEWEQHVPRLLEVDMDPLVGENDARYLCITPRAEAPASWPRRPAVRRRTPLF